MPEKDMLNKSQVHMIMNVPNFYQLTVQINNET